MSSRSVLVQIGVIIVNWWFIAGIGAGGHKVAGRSSYKDINTITGYNKQIYNIAGL